jgi:Dolichyl-phosphate-mannose-protein mannosyltransferase
MTLLTSGPPPSRTGAAGEPGLTGFSRFAPLAFVAAIAVATALAHLALGGRYDAMRNELYFIVCGRRPDFGYADQPPLAPLIAAATQLFGVNVWLLRLPAAVAATALVLVSAAFARLMGGGGVSMALAGAAAAIAPALVGMTVLLTTSTFEPLAWTAIAYCLTRAVALGQRRALIWAGLIAGLAFEVKYGVVFWLVPLAAGLLLTSNRRLLAAGEFWLGAALAAAIAAPNLIWQTAHGWPFFAITDRHARTIVTGGAVAFEVWQILALNPILAPLWLLGATAPFFVTAINPYRFLSIAFVGATTLVLASGGKDYYLFPAYPTMFALGAGGCARMRPWLAGAWVAAATALFLIVAPAALPILSPPDLAAYLNRFRLRPPPDELAAVAAPLTQVFSDEMGWRALEAEVAHIYRTLPEDERAAAAILASNYGEAAAIDVYGEADGLPPAISGNNQYFLWGPRGHDGKVIIHVNGSPERWRNYCGSVVIAGSFGAPFAMPYETGRPIFICRGLRRNLSSTWDRFKSYR